ncbi:MAG: nitrilase-related carbon-nitrogen hydrolase, partial [Candidatus Saccharimonadales bacterium]
MKDLKPISVAAIQMKIVSLDIDTNLQTAKRLLLEAIAKQSLDLVVFPEDCITGPIPAHPEYALDVDHYAIQFFRDLAREHQLY